MDKVCRIVGVEFRDGEFVFAAAVSKSVEPPTPSSVWACTICTFENIDIATATSCSMCESPRENKNASNPIDVDSAVSSSVEIDGTLKTTAAVSEDSPAVTKSPVVSSDLSKSTKKRNKRAKKVKAADILKSEADRITTISWGTVEEVCLAFICLAFASLASSLLQHVVVVSLDFI